MRTFIILAAATPLALLLAGCGETVSADQSRAEPMETEVAELDAAAGPMGAAPADAPAEIDFTGTYAREGTGGDERLTLDANAGTFEYTAPGGAVSSGSFTRLDDRRRISIADLDGQPGYFTIQDGELYRLEGEDTPPDEITVTGQYRREAAASAPAASAAQPTPPPPAGSGATTDSVSDRRN